jgi:hypothetical protein
MMRPIVAITLVIFLSAWTFNAYACLVPLYNAGQAPMGCGSQPEHPVREYCDVFKTFSVEPTDYDSPWLDIPTSSLEETNAVLLVKTFNSTILVGLSNSVAPPVGEVLAKLTILRL